MHGCQKIVGSREIDGLDDIGRAGATGDERRMTIESAIPEPPRLVVILILRKEQPPAQTGAEVFDVRQ
jgi:hypothetical protein